MAEFTLSSLPHRQFRKSELFGIPELFSPLLHRRCDKPAEKEKAVIE